jgi:hypothetical protein
MGDGQKQSAGNFIAIKLEHAGNASDLFYFHHPCLPPTSLETSDD